MTGLTWTHVSNPRDGTYHGIAWSPELGLFAAVDYATGGFGTRVITSPDGINWDIRGTPAGNMGWLSIAWSSALGLFCAVGDSMAPVITSPDGINWTKQTAPAITYNSVVWSPELGIFCAVAASGTHQVMTSSDGVNWTAYVIPETNTFVGITWSPELMLFCAVASSGAHQVMTSPDGANWTFRNASEVASWTAITWSPELGIFCAVGDIYVYDPTWGHKSTLAVMTSSNGIDWISHTQPQVSAASWLEKWTAITWSPELMLFMLVTTCRYGEDPSSGNLMTSSNGIDWINSSEIYIYDPWTSVVWSPELGMFVVMSNHWGEDVIIIGESIPPPSANVISTILTVDTNECTEPCTVNGTVSWTNDGGSVSDPTDLGIIVNETQIPIANAVIIGPGETTPLYEFSLPGLTVGIYTIGVSPNGGTDPQTIIVNPAPTPANIIATNMIPTPTACIAPCDVNIDVTYSNTGETAGTFTPEITVDGTSIILTPDTLGPGATVIKTFSSTDMLSGIHTICAVPLGTTTCQTIIVQSPPLGGAIIFGLVGIAVLGMMMATKSKKPEPFLHRDI